MLYVIRHAFKNGDNIYVIETNKIIGDITKEELIKKLDIDFDEFKAEYIDVVHISEGIINIDNKE